MSMSIASSTSGGGSAKNRFVYGKDDALFGSIERQQGDKPYGAVLDAGTGLHSLRWLGTLHAKGMERCVAVTADKNMQRNCQREVDALGVSNDFEVIIGNWFDEDDPLTMEEEQFDVILADYLIGAMDGFSPYAQDQMIPKLARLLKPGGKLFIVGLQPIPDRTPNDPDANLICKVREVRDACILLAGHRCYREYPVDWIQRQVQTCPGLILDHTSQFPILYKQETIVKQINVARSKFQYFPTPGLSTAMAAVLDDLESKLWEATQRSPTGRIQLGFDYIVTAQKEQ
eukprot:CAMPEP_0172453752 /NCGR_PEP_ID=MMETSP1065-20121228/10938_1 /TAXON_ID=265537 /ORGANISM="Amphiprora paludosa, Strain CCMP125" /LENGTH=286 /DNA_ID=CAMNT_0013205959 /DNA_START=144 /DNA_END=1004 /DNA_ORIENTATION=-